MVFLLTNTSCTLLFSSSGGYKHCLFVFLWAVLPFILLVCHWVTGLTMAKQHLHEPCRYWHRVSVTRLLVLGLGLLEGSSKEVCNLPFIPSQENCFSSYIAILLIHCILEKPNWYCMWSLLVLLSLYLYLCHLSPYIYVLSHPHGTYCFHLVVLVKTVGLQTPAKMENDLSWSTNFCSWKRGVWDLTVNVSVSKAGVRV